MKVHALRKINEYAKNNNFNLDYDSLLRYSIDDTNKILAFIDVNNKNVETVIDFIDWDLCTPDWKEYFKHLDGFENFDIREYLITKIVSAHSKCLSGLILSNFDFGEGDNQIVNLFNNVEEWKTYIENIGETMENKKQLVYSNIRVILENATSDRVDLLKQVMEYSQRGDFKPAILSVYFDDEYLKSYLSEILSLLIEGYDTEEVSDLFVKWEKDIANENVDELKKKINESYKNAIIYLKESKLFNHLKDDTGLIAIFNENNYTEYKDIITLLRAIEEKEDKELFNECLINRFILSNPIMRDYARRILYAKEENNDYRESLLHLFEQEIIGSSSFYLSEENVIRACNALILAQERDNNSMEMAKFITRLRHVEMIKDMKITKDNLSTRQVLYNHFPNFVVDSPISPNQIEYYADWLEKLSDLPSDVCQKVMNIINIPTVKNMDIELQQQLKELVLSPENFGSLEYIYTKYKDKEDEYNKYNSIKTSTQKAESEPSYNPEVELMTVLELLDSDNDIDKVLEGFNDDDEITPKTLIRSLAYKNKQNN